MAAKKSSTKKEPGQVSSPVSHIRSTPIGEYGFISELPAGTVKALWQVRFVSETFVAFPAALLIGASAWASRARRRYAWFSAVVAAALLVGGASLARDGFFAPDGGYGFILFWLLPLWVVVTAWSQSRIEPASEP